jgi:hypothetical protein
VSDNVLGFHCEALFQGNIDVKAGQFSADRISRLPLSHYPWQCSWAFVHFRASIGDPASGWGQVKIGVCERRVHQLALDNTSPDRPLYIQVPRYIPLQLFRKTKDV